MRALEGNRAAVARSQMAYQLGQSQRAGSTAEMNQVAGGVIECEPIRAGIELGDERRLVRRATEWIDRCLAVAMQAIRFDECLGSAGEIRMRRLVGRRYAGFSADRFRLRDRQKLKRGQGHFSLTSSGADRQYDQDTEPPPPRNASVRYSLSLHGSL